MLLKSCQRHVETYVILRSNPVIKSLARRCISLRIHAHYRSDSYINAAIARSLQQFSFTCGFRSNIQCRVRAAFRHR